MCLCEQRCWSLLFCRISVVGLERERFAVRGKSASAGVVVRL